MTDTDALADTLRAAAEKATKGPWKTSTNHRRKVLIRIVVGPSDVVYPDDGICESEHMNDRSFAENAANMNYIAAANPANILALLDEREALKAQLAEARREAFYEVADWHGKNSRLCLTASKDEPRLGDEDRRRAAEASRHHAASAASIRLKMADERRAAIRRLGDAG